MTALVPVAPVADDKPVLYVAFKVEEADYVLPADVVLQMETFTGATKVPGSPPFVAGVIQLRGKVVPAVDLRMRFGLPPRERTLETRVVVGELAGRIVALIVDSAREIVRITPSQLVPPPSVMGNGEGFVKAVVQLGPRTLMVLDFARVIGEEEKLDV